ncbi:hypothetical protein [Sinomicrobium sp.]
MEKQRFKIWVSLFFAFVWTVSFLGSSHHGVKTFGIAHHSSDDTTRLSMAQATVFPGIMWEEESSQSFFSGKIKILAYGLPVLLTVYINVPELLTSRELQESSKKTTDLKLLIEQLIFPFHFFY